jgi:putative aldouronate transport system permease protein
MSTRPVWMEPPTWWSRLGKGGLLLLIVVLVLFPVLVVVSTSLAGQAELTRNGGFVIVPARPTVAAYEAILRGGQVTRAVVVSLGVTMAGTFVSLVCTALAAYGLSRRGSFAHRPLLMLILLTFVFPPGIIPSYLVVRELGLLDSYAALILPVAVNAFNLVIMRGFFMEIPDELLDAAKIDGAGEWRTFLTIVVPLSKAVVAVVGLFYGVAYWNAFFNALLYLDDSTKWPLQLVVRAYVLQGSPLATPTATAEVMPPQQSIQMAVVVLALIPVLCLYPFIQRYFTKGVLTGAIKG